MRTVIYFFQCGLQFLQRTFREFGDKEEDIQRPTNIKLLGQNLGRNFKVSNVYI